ncbi:MAG: urea transporter [Bacteroidales bacterium]
MRRDIRSYQPFLRGILNSYSLVFFSTNQLFAWILLIVTFFDVTSGLAGLLAILTANSVAWIAGLNKDKISRGYYGFNALLVGLGLGMYFSASPEFFLVLVFSALLTLFVTIVMEGVIGKYYLPYLSLPFLFGLWLALMATREFNYLEISQRGVYTLNEMYTLGGMTMVRVYEWFNQTGLPGSLVIYFRSLGAIFFQYHLFPGLLIAIGLLCYSRIAFVLSLLGFYAGVAAALGVDEALAARAMTQMCRRAMAIFDVQTREYRHREIFEAPIDPTEFFPPDPRQLEADALVDAGRVELRRDEERVTERPVRGGGGHGEGEPVTRVYVDRMLEGVAEGFEVEVVLKSSGQIIFGRCTCPFFEENMLNRGPCAHMLAMRRRADTIDTAPGEFL